MAPATDNPSWSLTPADAGQPAKEAEAVIRLMFEDQNLDLNIYRSLRRELSNSTEPVLRFKQEMAAVEADARRLDRRPETVERYSTARWVLTLGDAAATVYPHLTDGEPVVYGFDWLERPGLVATRFSLPQAPRKAELAGNGSAARELTFDRRVLHFDGVGEEVPAQILAGVLRGLVELPRKQVEENPLAQALLLYCTDIVIERERSQGELSFGANRKERLGTTLLDDYVLYADILSSLSRHSESLRKLMPWKIHGNGFEGLRLPAFEVALNVCLPHTDPRLNLRSPRGDRPLIECFYDEIARSENRGEGRVIKGSPREVWEETVTRWLRHKDGDAVTGEHRRLALRPLLWMALKTVDNSPRPSGNREASEAHVPIQDPETMIRLLERYYSELARCKPILHDGRGLAYEILQKALIAPEAEDIPSGSLPIVRPGFGGEGIDEADLDVVYSSLRRFCADERWLKVLRDEKNWSVQAAILLYSFTDFAHQNRFREADKDPGLRVERYVAGLRKLIDFSKTARDDDWALFFAHARWTPQYWREETWRSDDSGLTRQKELAGFTCESPRLEYHRRHVEVLALLVERLASPPRFEKSKDLGHSPDASVLATIRERQDDPKEKVLWGLYKKLADTVYRGRLIATQQKFEPLTTSTNPGEVRKEEKGESIQILFGGEEGLTEQAIGEFFTAGGEARPISNEFKLLIKKYANPQNYSNEFPLFSHVAPTLHDKLYKFYALPGAEDDLLSRLDGPLIEVDWESGHRGEYLYAEAVRTLVHLTFAQLAERSANRRHRSVGFLFEPDTATGEWLDDEKIVDSLRAARSSHLRAQSIYRAYTDTARIEPVLNASGTGHPFGYGLYDLARLQSSSEGRFAVQHITRPVCIEVVPFSTGNGQNPRVFLIAEQQSLSRLLLTGLIRTRTAVNRVDAAQDTVGFTGAVPMVRGTEELFARLKFLAACLREANIKEPTRYLKQALSLKREVFAFEAARSRVHEEAYRLGAIQQQIIAARFAEERALFERHARESEVFVSHFDTESARQLAESAHQEAAAKLLDSNLAAYSAFATKAQVEMLLSALPAYVLHLHKAKLSLGQTGRYLDGLQNELYEKRKQYLEDDSKDLLGIIKSIVAKLVDVVCVCYGLPPIGSLVDQTFDGIKAASEGRWEDAMNSAGKVASLSGLDKEADKLFKGEVDKLLDSDIAKKLKDSEFLHAIGETAMEAGLDEFAKAKALAILNNTGKSFLPDRLVDSLVPPKDLKWPDDIKPEEVKQVLGTQALMQGGEILKELGKSGLLAALDELSSPEPGKDGSRFRKFVLEKAGVKEGDHPDLGKELAGTLKQSRQRVSASLEELFNGKGRMEDEKVRQQIALAVPEIKLRKTRPAELAEAELEKVIGELRSKGLESDDFWKKTLPGFLKEHHWDEQLQAKLGTLFSRKRLARGEIPTAEDLLDSVAQAFVTGTIRAHLEKAGMNGGDDYAQKVATLKSTFKEMLVGMQCSVDLAVSVDLSRQFFPKQKGRLIELLGTWETELDELFAGAKDVKSSLDLRNYFESAKQSFNQVDLENIMNKDTFEYFMNPPKVGLRPEFQQKLDSIDAALSQAQQVVRAVTASDSEIRKHMEEIAKAKDEQVFRESATRLFSGFLDAVNGAMSKIDEATKEAGSPDSKVTEFLVNSQDLRACATREFERYSKLQRRDLFGTLIRERESARQALPEPFVKRFINPALDLYRSELQILEGQLGEKGSHSREELATLLKVAEGGMFDAMNALLPADNKLQALDRDLLFRHAGDKPADKEMFHRTSKMVVKLARLGGDTSGLFLIAKHEHERAWEDEIRALSKDYESKAHSHRAIALGLRASAWRARKNASEIREKQAEVEIKIAKQNSQVLRHLERAQQAHLGAAQYDFQAAATQRDLAMIDRWEFSEFGEDAELMSPDEVRLVSQDVWRTFHDIVFFLKYYEGKEVSAAAFRDFVSRNQEKILSEDGIWKPDAILKAIASLELNGLLQNSRFSGSNGILNRQGNKPGITIGPQELVALGKDVDKNYTSLLIEILPTDVEVDRPYPNPAPALYEGDAIGLGLQYEFGKRPRLTSVIPENPTRFRSRLISVGYVTTGWPEDSNIDPNSMLFSHLGDGFLTVLSWDGAKKTVPVRWPPLSRRLKFKAHQVGGITYQIKDSQLASGPRDLDPEIGIAGGTTIKDSQLESDRIDRATSLQPVDFFDALENDAATRDHLRKYISKAFEDETPFDKRLPYYQYPLCGTYEILIPTRLKSYVGWTIRLIFLGSTTNQ